MKNYAVEIEKMETQLDLCGAKIRLLEAKIVSANSITKLQRAREINELRRKQNLAAEKLYEMKNATTSAWEQIKEAADKILDELKTGIDNNRADVDVT